MLNFKLWFSIVKVPRFIGWVKTMYILKQFQYFTEFQTFIGEILAGSTSSKDIWCILRSVTYFVGKDILPYSLK